MIGAISNGLKALAIALGWIKQSSDQNIGRELQAGDQLRKNEKANLDATIISERNAARDHRTLAERVREQTGAEP